MNNILADKIFELFESDNVTLVFDSSSATRQYMAKYASKKGSVVDGDKAIGLDELISLMVPADTRAVDEYERADFIAGEIKNLFNSPLSSRYMKLEHAYRICSEILANGEKILSDRTNDTFVSAFIDIWRDYKAFLDSRGLYDPKYSILDPSRLKKRYVLVLPEASMRMQQFLQRISKSTVDFIPLRYKKEEEKIATWQRWIEKNALDAFKRASREDGIEFLEQSESSCFYLLNISEQIYGMIKGKKTLPFDYYVELSDGDMHCREKEKLSEWLMSNAKSILHQSLKSIDEQMANLFLKAVEDNHLILVKSIYPENQFRLKLGEIYFESISIHDMDISLPSIKFFSNERLEIREAMKSIREYVESNEKKGRPIRYLDIILTVTDFDRLRDYLSMEARVFGVPLDFGDIPFSRTKYGMLCRSFAELLNTRGGFEAVMELSSLPVFSSPAKEALQKIVGDMIRYRKGTILEYASYEKRYKTGYLNELEKIIRSDKSFEEKYRSFASAFPVEIYEKEGASEFFNVLRLSHNIDDVSILLGVIDGIRIKKPTKTDCGIRVFSYGSDVAYFAKRRYLLGLAEESMKMRSPEYGFLGWKDMEKLNEYGFNLSDLDTSKDLLSSYVLSSDELFISGSHHCYGKEDTYPMVFYESRVEDGKAEKGNVFFSNEYSEEYYTENDETLDKKWIGVGKDYFEANPEEKRMISGSNIDNAESCILRVMLSSQNALKNTRGNWTPDEPDKATEGTIMHSAVERYIIEQKLAEFDESIFRRILEDECSKKMYSTSEAAYLFVKYKIGVSSFIEELREKAGGSPYIISIERKISHDDSADDMSDLTNTVIENGEIRREGNIMISESEPYGSLLRSSKIDIMMQDAEGNVSIYDLKTGDVKNLKYSKQLDLYIRLLKTDDADCFFFSLKNGLKQSGKNAKEKVGDLLMAIKAKIEDAEWTATSKKDDCPKCPFGNVCRKEYFV